MASRHPISELISHCLNVCYGGHCNSVYSRVGYRLSLEISMIKTLESSIRCSMSMATSSTCDRNIARFTN